ncbi:unnamed protein product [Camellia sinensis]
MAVENLTSNNFDPRAAAANFPSGHCCAGNPAWICSCIQGQGASCYDSFPTLRPISGGWRHTMALTSDGKLYGWGWNKLAVLGGSLLGTFLSEK